VRDIDPPRSKRSDANPYISDRRRRARLQARRPGRLPRCSKHTVSNSHTVSSRKKQ